MNSAVEFKSETRILAILWHSPYEYIVAGGFRRTQEILKRTPDNIHVCAIDSSPTMLEGTSGRLEIKEYGFPSTIRRLDRKFFVLTRLIEWSFALLSMMVICLRLRLRGERFDVVYVPSSEIVPALIAGIFAKFMFSCRLVVCNTNIEFYAPCARRILAWLHNVSDQVITLSNDLTQSLRRNGVKAPIALNAVGLDLDMISKSLSNVEGRKNYEAVFVGRHDQGKGIFDLVQAWSIVTGRLPQATLITIGIMTPEYAAKLERLIAELGMEHRVVLSGVLDEKTKFRLIRESKVCLFPSYLEGWGIVPQEALACGLPVVLYDLPVYRENIRPCESVFTVPIGDVRALAEKALELLSDDRYEKYKEVGPEFVQRFRWAEIAGVEFDILVGGAPRAKVTRTSA